MQINKRATDAHCPCVAGIQPGIGPAIARAAARGFFPLHTDPALGLLDGLEK
jgi:hypothetical protein